MYVYHKIILYLKKKPMGNPISPLVANIVMDNLEKNKRRNGSFEN